ncbi:Tail-specific protease [Lysobacter dokdonensis DS-58]|uniref:Tail-specific protease n=1 Tax=Lysobacter dokdonensis DS-58 TaxID=1300345 RepID=A0A0A2WY57_9GAMM|nr:carboxy terminal-processing peptidase [Lysobacter dokdonensis]KGQ17964.1 Tail-specific protease [Lysobacter dokdonensis DS-58]
MKLSKTLPVISLALALTAPIALLARGADDDATLAGAPSAAQAKTAELVYGLLSDSRFAYRPRALDDTLSRDIHKRYLEAMDPGKLFFTAQDIAKFAPYQTQLDDAIKSGKMDAAYAMFAVYKQRVAERTAYARKVLKTDKFDFSGSDRYDYERKDAPWADAATLDKIWTQSVRNDWLRLKLAGKAPDDIRKTLDKRYANLVNGIDDLNGEDIFQTFLTSYANSIDPHTDYFNPRTAANFNLTMSLSLEGIGAVLQKQDETVVIREIIVGGPAARSGKLKPGDRIVAVGQGTSGEMKDVVGWRIDDVVEQIRGKKGTPVRLDVVSAEMPADSKPSRLVLTRDKIRLEEQAAKAQTITVPGVAGGASRKIGVIKLPAFYQDFEGRRKNANDYASATRDVAKLLAQLKVQKVDGVVLDLRNNGGGSLTEAVELTGLFVDRGPVVQVVESGGRVVVEDDTRAGVAWDGPLAVLINRGSASASEIFAGAIQDYGRGLVIGETTFGKGTVQNLIDLDRWPQNDGDKYGQVKLTIAQFFRISGSSTQHKGVVPDIRFPVTVDASEFGESTYDNALPWSRIQAVDHTQYGNFAPIIPRLDALHTARVAKDKEFQWWSEDVAQFRAESEKKFVSLNEAERRAERDKFEAKRKQRQAERKALGLPLDPFAEDKDDGLQANERNIAEDAKREKLEEKRPDPLLRESAAILADALTLLTNDQKLSQQVLPASRTMGHWSE